MEYIYQRKYQKMFHHKQGLTSAETLKDSPIFVREIKNSTASVYISICFSCLDGYIINMDVSHGLK